MAPVKSCDQLGLTDEEVAAGVAKQQASWEAYLDALLDLTSGKSERHDDAGKGKPN